MAQPTSRRCKPQLPMRTCSQNIDVKSLCQEERNFRQLSLSQSLAKAMPKRRPDSDSWRLVHSDGSTWDFLVGDNTATNKIAALCGVAADEPATPLRPKIIMPTSMTDLEELLKTDKVCMVSRQFRPSSTPTKNQGITLRNLM